MSSSLLDKTQTSVACAITRLDQWLQTMRGPGGYGGPISHWWESSLLYCGPMADWRYEGIICGYLALYRATGLTMWLTRAKRAGDDLVSAQLPSGMFRNSAFQQGPMDGGTPHEAAADIALLELTQVLREIGDESWETYRETARRNIEEYILGKLWSGQGFRDQPWNRTFVPNKNATVIEALTIYEALSGLDMSEYLESAAAVILAAQERTGPRSGATIHTGTGRHKLAIGIYTARSACALLRLHERHPSDKWLEAIGGALSFLRGLYTALGPYFGRYPNGSPIANPRLIAGSGDILRAMVRGREFGLATDADVDGLVQVLVQSQLPSGGIPTGFGFAWRGDQRVYEGLPEFRDVLPVVGWCDKAFRALALVASPSDIEMANSPINEVHAECIWRGRTCLYYESAIEMQLLDARTSDEIYCWKKGSCYPDVYQLN